jgi:hypothetical protein
MRGRLKKCTKCGVFKKRESFGKDRSRQDGLFPWCLKCKSDHRLLDKEGVSKYNAEYAKNNAERIKAQRKIWRKKNAERILKYYSEYNRKNKKIKNIKALKYIKMRRLVDPAYRIMRNLKSRFAFGFKNNYKKSSLFNYLGCTVQELKIHLESQFKEGMSWNNYGNKEGNWSIDHVLPCSSFDHSDEEEIKKCWHYSNMQPMWHIENIKKGSRIA